MPEPRGHGAGERLSRRTALAGGLAGAAGFALGAPPAAARGTGEGEALTELVRAEYDAAFVYRHAALGEASMLAAQDEEHAMALASHLEALALPIPRPTGGRADLAPEALAVLGTSGRDARQAAIAYERSLIAGCARRLPRLVEPDSVRTAATVMASHAQHLVLHELTARR